MYINTLMSMKNGGRESFVNIKPKHPAMCGCRDLWCSGSDVQMF